MVLRGKDAVLSSSEIGPLCPLGRKSQHLKLEREESTWSLVYHPASERQPLSSGAGGYASF